MKCLLYGHVPQRVRTSGRRPGSDDPPVGTEVTICLHCNKTLYLEPQEQRGGYYALEQEQDQ